MAGIRVKFHVEADGRLAGDVTSAISGKQGFQTAGPEMAAQSVLGNEY